MPSGQRTVITSSASGATRRSPPPARSGAPKTPRRGFVTYRVQTRAEASGRASADPMVKAGRLALELSEWMIPVGIRDRARNGGSQ